MSERRKMNISLSIEEQETHVNFSRGDERAVIYTTDTTQITNFNKLIEIPDTEWKLETVTKMGGKVVGYTYSCPIEFLTFRRKRTTRQYTEKEREAMRERMRNIRKARKS